MKTTTLTITIASLALVSFADARGAPPEAGGAESVAAARKSLDEARGNLAKAVQRIEKDPPSTTDLDAAHAAVGVLKDAIDAGAELEPKDLDYARAALVARKELRTYREYVDQRRAKVHIHNYRRTIDGALANLAERVRGVGDKAASPKDFDGARAAAAALRKAVEEARPFTKDDEKFAGYVAEADATLARHEKAIDDNWTRLSVEKQRALLEESRRAMSASIAALGKGATDAQFETADRAASQLARQLEEGKALEAKDKAYRSDADRARTELAQSKKRMDELWTKTGLERLKAEIEPAHKDLVAGRRAVRSKNPTAEQLAEARTAAIVVAKLIEKFRPQAERSAAFGQYVNDVQKTLVEVEVELARRGLESARAAMASALRDIEGRAPSAEDKGATDAQFENANRASAKLTKQLEEGKTLEAKDKTYRADADRARTELAQAKKRVDDLWAKAGLERLKAEIEPARKDLVAARREVRSKNPTAEQLAEARTAAIVVAKLIEKFQPQAEKAPAFGQYVGEVKETLVEVEVELELRSLDSARAALAKALRNIESKAPTDQHFADANSALVALEKTLETVRAKHPATAKPVADARALLATSRTTIAKRRIEIDVQRQRAEVEAGRKTAGDLIGRLQQPDFGEAQLQEAEKGVKELLATVDAGVELTKKDREYAAYDREVRKRIAELNDRVAKRRIVFMANDSRTALNGKIAETKSKLDASKQPQATDADIEAASQAVDALKKALEEKATLEDQDKGYAAFADKARGQLDGLREGLASAKRARELRRRTAEAFAAGALAADAAAAARDLRAQKAQHEKAAAHFKSCQSAGTSMIEEDRALGNVAVFVEGRQSTAKDVIGLCAERLKATEQLVTQVTVFVDVEDGPKRFFEAGKGLLAKGNKGEALVQFSECISSGVILQNRHPGLKDRRFEVAGTPLTLAELTQQCIRQRDSLKAK